MEIFRQPQRAQEVSPLPPLDTSFSFSSAPRTPEPQEAPSSPPALPEPPRIRIKRRRPALESSNDQAQHHHLDTLPSIELSESDPTQVIADDSTSTDEKMLSPVLGSVQLAHPRFISPPRTPVSKAYFDNFDWFARRHTPVGADLTRPSSAFSQLSDSSSSFSSNSSSGTFTTITDGCFTPLSEHKDSLPGSSLASPVQFVSAKKEGKKPAKASKGEVRWTREMEDHLWRCYLSYLQDPTVTPFKTLPGVPPPIGVCHRVAHIARKTWRGRRVRLLPVVEDPASSFMSLDGTVMRREASAPATAMQPEEPLSPSLMQPWPKESATRKHLRSLCRSKPSISPHYQRLMQTRSPSPMESSSRARQSSTPAPSSSTVFSTRDLNIDLTTSTSASMQPTGPLAQLASDSSSSFDRRTNVHQKSQSLEHDLTFSLPTGHEPASPRRLASPFVEQRRNTLTTPNLLPTPLQSSQISEQQQRSIHCSPLPELQHPQPRPLSNSMKRRAQYPLGDEYLSADPETRLDFLQSLFADPAAAAGKRRVRSRGFSVGAGAIRQSSGSAYAQQPQRHISNLFSPPDETPAHAPGPMRLDTSAALAPPASLPSFALPENSGAPRLGSPFVPSFSLSNTFPRNVFPANAGGATLPGSVNDERMNTDPEDPFI